MRTRLELHEKLKEILGSNNVYFQPPENLKIKYPAIVYVRREINNSFANDDVYSQRFFYEITVIDKNPESEIVYKLSRLPKIRQLQHFISDNIYHDVFNLFL